MPTVLAGGRSRISPDSAKRAVARVLALRERGTTMEG